MVLDLKRIFLNEGESLSFSCEIDLSKLEFDGYYPFEKPVEVFVSVQNSAGVVTFDANVRFDYFHPCDRCMVDVIRNFEYSFRHVLVTKEDDDSDDNDYIVLHDYILDLDELIKSDLLLQLPSKILCCEDCRGLCPKCGKNLNVDTCSCVIHEGDPRLQVLKDLID